MRTIDEIKYEMRETGYIIDDRSLHKIPFYPYVQEYAKLMLELYGAITDGIHLDRLEEICQAERDERCVVLETNIPSAVYAVNDLDVIKWLVLSVEIELEKRTYHAHHASKKHGVGHGRIRTGDFGKTVFLTREEAEAALKEANDHDT